MRSKHEIEQAANQVLASANLKNARHAAAKGKTDSCHGRDPDVSNGCQRIAIHAVGTAVTPQEKLVTTTLK